MWQRRRTWRQKRKTTEKKEKGQTKRGKTKEKTRETAIVRASVDEAETGRGDRVACEAQETMGNNWRRLLDIRNDAGHLGVPTTDARRNDKESEVPKQKPRRAMAGAEEHPAEMTTHQLEKKLTRNAVGKKRKQLYGDRFGRWRGDPTRMDAADTVYLHSRETRFRPSW